MSKFIIYFKNIIPRNIKARARGLAGCVEKFLPGDSVAGIFGWCSGQPKLVRLQTAGKAGGRTNIVSREANVMSDEPAFPAPLDTMT